MLYVLICFFGHDRAPTFNSIPIILNSLTNRNIALFYSVIIYEQKTKDCAWSGRLPTETTQLTTAPLFSTLMFVGFHNQSSLLTMMSHDFYLTRAINKSSCPLHEVVFIHDALFLRMRTSSF